VLIEALTLTACAAFYVAEAAPEGDRLRFKRTSDRTRNAMTARLRTYVAALRGGAGCQRYLAKPVSPVQFAATAALLVSD
jgi:CHASE1-domain containing sensor protein